MNSTISLISPCLDEHSANETSLSKKEGELQRFHLVPSNNE